MNLMEIGKVQPVGIVEEMQRSYLDYAMSVIVSRALPDIRDGLKPVHRRILFAMHKLGLSHQSRYSKSAKVVGEVLGKYHPHGDMPVYDALVRMAQHFSMRYQLIDGQGNFGSVDGDPPAAMRYTEVRMSKIASEMLFDIEKETVSSSDNFDASLKEPNFLPAAIPNLLLMGAEGIAVGMATKIPTHNLKEVVDALIYTIDKQIKNPEAEVAVDELTEFIKGPDFPTGASAYDIFEIKNAYNTGRGRIVLRAKAGIEEQASGKSAVIVTEIPYQVNKAHLVAKIAGLVKDKKITDISDLRDESDKSGVRIVIELKRNAIPKKVLNRLYKYTQMQTVFAVNMVALIDNTPQTVNLKTILNEFIKHRINIIRKRSEFELKQAKAREHILEGLKIAVDHIDEVIETIKKSKDVEDARIQLMAKFKLTEIQAQAILDMQLKRLAALERQKIEDELIEVRKKITYLTELLASSFKILNVIKEELLVIKEKYGDERKTKIYKGRVGEFSEEDLIPNEETIISITKTGYIKRLSKAAFKLQHRGGKGVVGMTTKEQDEIDKLINAKTHDFLLFFTNKGRVFKTRAWEIPETSRVAKGQAIINLINIEQGEMIQSVLTVKPELLANSNSANMFMATRNGVIKRTTLSEYENIKSSGLIAINLDKGDELVWVKKTSGSDEIMLTTYQGKVIRFPESEVRATGRATRGVTGIKLQKKDFVVAMEAFKITDNGSAKKKKAIKDLLVVTCNGLGKRTNTDEFRNQHRGGVGVKVANINSKTGPVAAAFIVDENYEQLIISSKKGQVIRLPLKNIPRLSRNTQGVILMRFNDKTNTVAAAAAI